MILTTGAAGAASVRAIASKAALGAARVVELPLPDETSSGLPIGLRADSLHEELRLRATLHPSGQWARLLLDGLAPRATRAVGDPMHEEPPDGLFDARTHGRRCRRSLWKVLRCVSST